MDRKQTKRFTVNKSGIKCCALNCPGSTSEEVEKFFFSFPPCNLASKRSIERCRTWVKKTGNAKLLECPSTELAEKFYLCCSHFSDWRPINSNTRVIDVGAVPIFFDCPPLSNQEMEPFPVTTEALPKDNSSGNSNPSLLPNGEDKSGCEVQQESKTSVDKKHRAPSQEKTEILETSNGSASNSSNSKEEEQASPVTEPAVEKNTRTSSPPASLLRPRKAKQNAVNKISSQQQSLENDDEPVKKISKSSFGKDNENSVGNCGSLESEIDEEGIKLEKSSLESDDDTAGKTLIIEKPEDKQRAEKLAEPSSQSIENTTGKQKVKKLKFRKQKRGKLSMTAQEIGIKNSPSTSIQTTDPHPFFNKSLILSKNIFKMVSPENSKSAKGSLRQKFREVVGNSCNSKEICRNATKGTSEFDSLNSTASVEPDIGTNGVIAYLSSTATQTCVGSFDKGHEMLKILDSDRKLGVFSGIPTYSILEELTKCTLNMVMNNRTLICDMEPTLREWIIITCTKFHLNLSIEALSVMFEVVEDECKRIVDQTCLFLRKTLSLLECQKYVWVLPEKVLNGIADYSDVVYRNF